MGQSHQYQFIPHLQQLQQHTTNLLHTHQHQNSTVLDQLIPPRQPNHPNCTNQPLNLMNLNLTNLTNQHQSLMNLSFISQHLNPIPLCPSSTVLSLLFQHTRLNKIMFLSHINQPLNLTPLSDINPTNQTLNLINLTNLSQNHPIMTIKSTNIFQW